ncbi:MAG: glycosyltransferase [Myxococcales bacterium]|nr:glycosyltransferase [Myxococcales bacterium]
MLDLVDVGERQLESYRGIAPDALLDGLRREAGPLRGARVLHVNATPYGGGVSELLRSVVPLLNDLGLIAHWRIVSGGESFFQVTKLIHNGLQGAPRALSQAEQSTYLENSRLNAAAFTEEYDFVFVHDPQPAALPEFRGKGEAKWIWRCHIDTSNPHPPVWEFLRPFLRAYDAAIFTLGDFVPPDFPISPVQLVPPAIDPLSPKNLTLEEGTAQRILEWIGVRTDRPLITQVSRFDPWKDPLGVVAAYRMAREAVSGLQLALVGSFALDDPEGWKVYRELAELSRRDPRVHVFTNLVGVGNVEVNAFQTLSDVVVQKSIREGFGLVVSESMWKGTPVVAGRTGGIPLQMADGVGGILVDSVEECAQAMVALLGDPERARRLGESGRQRVREHFLLPRLVLNELSLLRKLWGGKAVSRPAHLAAGRDPVCGMSLGEEPPLTAEVHGRRFGFCSELCHLTFLHRPERYLAAVGAVGAGAPGPA